MEGGGHKRLKKLDIISGRPHKSIIIPKNTKKMCHLEYKGEIKHNKILLYIFKMFSFLFAKFN